MSATPQPAQASADSTVVQVILAVALGHFLNDLMQSLIPAAYPHGEGFAACRAVSRTCSANAVISGEQQP